jgi:copper chaperone CopZ
MYVAAFALMVVAGCSETASTEDAALSNSEAAAMVAAETEATEGAESAAAAETAAAEEAAAAATPVAFNIEGAPTVEFSVPDMMCEDSCVPTVRETLAAQPGVKDVKVELATKKATVAVDQDKFDADAAVAALVDLQFTETKLLPGEGEQADN